MPNNKPYILTRKSLNPTAKRLAKALGLEKSFEPRSYPPLIRWGNSDGGGYHTETNYNLFSIIRIAAHKLKFSDAMFAANLPHVEILSGVPAQFPVVVRHNLSASRGVGIQVVTSNVDIDGEGDPEDIWRNLYWSYWRDFAFELGVHFFDGQILRVFKKMPGENVVNETHPIKNASKGWHFSLVDAAKYPKLLPIVREFSDRFGMRFGRLDIGWNSERRLYEIIEVNSAPSLAENQNTFNLYVENFKKALGI